MKRRQLFRYSLSFFLGLNLVYLKSKSVKSENSPDSGDENNLITSVSGMIPSSLSLKFFQNVLSPNEIFNNYYSHFVNQGFKLETDSMRFIDIQNRTKEPFFLTQLSGRKEFECRANGTRRNRGGGDYLSYVYLIHLNNAIVLFDG